MTQIKEQFQKIIKSKTVPEMITNTPSNFLYFLLFVPLLLIMALPVRQLAEDFINPDGQISTYASNVSAIHKMAFSFEIIFFILAGAKYKVEKKNNLKLFSSKSPLIFFSFVVIMMLVSTAANGITDAVKHGDTYRRESLCTSIMYFSFYFLASSLIKCKKKKAVLLYTFIITNLPIAVCMLIHTYIKEITAFSIKQGPSAIFYNSNHYGYYILMVILVSEVLFIKEKNSFLRIICMISFLLNNIILIINDTFGCYLACFLALPFSVIVISLCDKKFNKAAVVMFALFVLISLIMSIWYETVFSNIITFATDLTKLKNNTDDSGSAGTGRWNLWRHTVGYITEKPILGFGLEGIGDRLESEANNDRPHCEFIQYAAFYGIPAAIAYICGTFSVFLNGLKQKNNLDIYTIAALVAAFGYLVSSAFGNTMFYTAPYFFILLGIGFSTKR